jgi:general secretion pathway protein D
MVEITPGTGRFFDNKRAAPPGPPLSITGEITLNFENASIREVVHVILGELLEENYVIDDAVNGSVTLQTSRPLPREALLETLESLLRLNGATLVEAENGVYQVRPREGALRGNGVPRTSPGGPWAPGMGVYIAPLEFIAANEMVKILEPFLTPNALVRVDPVRNLLILAGSRRELTQWQETIDIFDVDWVQGMSVALFTLHSTGVEEVMAELEQVIGLGSEAPMAGLFHLVPIERLNAILVLTPQPRYLEEAREWIKRLDRSSDTARTRLHVYRMQHVKASEVADLLTQMFSDGSGGTGGSTAPALAPGLEPVEIGAATGEDTSASPPEAPAARTVSLGGDEDNASGLQGETRIIADEANNALLIMASDRDFEQLQEALKQLDIPRLQVLVDATIVEVRLVDELRYGLQWFFTNSLPGGYDGEGILSQAAQIARTFPGFNYSIVDSAGRVRAVLDALAQDSLVNVLSAPSLMVLDNEEALIQVGDQVPILTSSSTSTVTSDPLTVNSISYRDTGVTLRVTPRVNAGGMVQLDVEQEVTDVTTTTSSNIDSPTLLQRLIRSTVAVQSGDTIVLGGLIRENSSRGKAGIPGLYKLPVIGPLFGSTQADVRRNELLVLLTPRVAENAGEARAITESFRQRMKGLEGRVRDATRRNLEMW